MAYFSTVKHELLTTLVEIQLRRCLEKFVKISNFDKRFNEGIFTKFRRKLLTKLLRIFIFFNYGRIFF